MPFGLSNAPSSFCRLMSLVLDDLLWVICLCYIDDIVVYGRTQAELLERLDTVLTRFLRKFGLKVTYLVTRDLDHGRLYNSIIQTSMP